MARYYEILGVNSDASEEDIRRAYRRISLANHPDRGGNSDKYHEAREAYETLSNPHTRLIYDEKHRVSSSFLPIMTPSASPAASSPKEVTLEVTFEQAYSGCTLPISANGEVFYVDIPQGIDTNEVIRVPYHSGCICVRIVIVGTPSHIARDGLKLTYTKEITLCEALCGFEFSIQLFGKSYTIRNDDGLIVTHGETRVVRGLGMRRNDHVGDLVIQFHVSFPKQKLSAEQCTWLRRNLGQTSVPSK
jgi:DnaJ-class molecular chaperone